MEWTAEALYGKARLYIERAHAEPIDSQLFALWTSLALEHLCRASLAKIHPVLLADPREDGNLLYAFGIQPSKPPKSIVTKALVIRCTRLVEGFTEAMAAHCALLADQRNMELHSGAVGFDDFDNSAWLPTTYEIMEVLLRHMGQSFEEFLGEDHAPTALAMLRDRRETLKKEIEDRIRASAKAYAALTNDAKANLEEKWKPKIADWLRGHKLHRTASCPACKSRGAMTGEIVSRGPVRIDESQSAIEREVRVLPTKFWCPFCSLRFDGYQEMRAAGLGGIYTRTEDEDPVEFFGIDPHDYVDVSALMRELHQQEYDNE